MEAIRQRIQTSIPDNIKQIPENLKPKPPHHLEHGADSIPTTLAATLVSPTLSTPTAGSVNAVFTIAAATPISSPPLTVLAAVLNPSTYATWNPVFPKATITRAAPSPVPPLLEGSPVAASKPGDILLQGTHVTFEVHLNLDPAKVTSNSTCVVTKLEEFAKATTAAGGNEHRGRKGYRVCWKTTGWQPPPFVLKAERVHEFLESEDGTGTEYRCYETFSGPLAQVMRFTMVGQLEAAFAAWMDGLKRFVEGGSNVNAAPAVAAAATTDTAAAPAAAAATTTAPAAAAAS
ncbi:hypothetical protein CPLU01_02181 [Colletotrichum plurivorum]|uniref:Uncharacterized protein n=1 Tax=Colletotrichum plurivorum TaxID=2175906 RepID=A0A8H6KX74_9PEZI|nr:hypothetical protein CPLU01_02181 [Colletotrichum plurivorum]